MYGSGRNADLPGTRVRRARPGCSHLRLVRKNRESSGLGLVEPDREEVADGRLRRYYRLTDEGATLLGAETERRRASAAVAAQRLRARLAGGTA